MAKHDTLKGYIFKPLVMNKIIDTLKAGPEEMTLTDIRIDTGLKSSQISRTMSRLLTKKYITRRQIVRSWTFHKSDIGRTVSQQRLYWAYKLTNAGKKL